MEEENVLEIVSELLRSKSNKNCSVYGCKSVHRKNRNISYHKFPKKGKLIRVESDFGEYHVDQRKLWEVRLKMGKKILDHMLVCSLHFKKEDFSSTGCFDKRRLLPNAVPSQNLPNTKFHYINEKRKEGRRLRLDRRRNFTLPSSSKDEQQETIANLTTPRDDHEIVAAETLLLLADKSDITTFIDIGTQTQNPLFRTTGTQTECDLLDAEVQVNTESVYQFSESISTNKRLNSLTGLHSFILLNALVSLFATNKDDDRPHKLTDKSRVFLTFMKLKLDLPYVVLGALFRVTSQTCKRIFIETIDILATPLKEAIMFPAFEQIQRNMPKCFEDFSNVRIILDCTEIMVQKPKRLCCRIKLYSNYKGTTTAKFMTGVAPSGLITFVSKGFGGRTSDKTIFESSNLISRLRMNRDAIMVDKGFHIKEICEAFGIKLIQPPFLRQKSQFSTSEALLNAKIASARVHIERSNQRIKIFKILNNRLPLNLIPIIDDIFLIASAITNLSNPILSDDKFL